VVAGVHDLSAENAKTLSLLPAHQSSTLIVTKIESGSESSAQSAIESIKTANNITKLDIVIANAGIGYYYAPAASTSVSEFQNHFLINSIGPLILFQAALPLLKASSNPRFVPISSALGSMGVMDKAPLPCTAYGKLEGCGELTDEEDPSGE
jgi:norsolorinic acid ketoreductase